MYAKQISDLSDKVYYCLSIVEAGMSLAHLRSKGGA